jgi:hypothetical protein
VKALFVTTTCLTVLLGVGWLFFPEAMLSGWGVEAHAPTVYMARRYGGLFWGYAVLLWLSRSAAPSPARTAILAGGTVVNVVMTLVSLLGALSGVVSPAIWFAVAVEGVLAVAFVYQLAATRSR